MTRASTLRNHWRPEVPDYLTWHLLFDDRPALHALAERYQRLLHGIEGIDVVPTRWLHLTVQDVGRVDEIAEDDLAALVGAARQRLAELPPIALTFEPAEVQWEGVTLTASPAEAVAVVRSALRTAISAVHGLDRVPGDDGDALWPHVSLAYANAAVPAAALFDAIADVPRASIEVKIDTATLIALRRDGRQYVWSPVASARLGHG